MTVEAARGTRECRDAQSSCEVSSDSGDESMQLPAPTVSSLNLVAMRSLVLRMTDASISTGKAKIDHWDVKASKAIEDAAAAREAAAKARSEEGGFFDGLATAAEALTVDLVKLKNITDPFGAVERSLDKAGAATIDSRQFWGDLEKGALEVAKWGAVAGSVTLAVGSFGAAAPVAALAVVGAVMSCAAAADSSFQILEKCGVDKETAMWVDVGLCVGGALASGGAGVAQMLSSQSTQLTTAVRAGALIADGTAGGGALVGGAAHIQVAAFERTAKHAEADAMQADLTQERFQRLTERAVEAMRETYESSVRTTQRVAGAINKENSTAVAMMVRA